MAGDVELWLKIWFYGEDGTLAGYDEFYRGDAPEPMDCDAGTDVSIEPYLDVISHAIPEGGAHRIEVEVWENDCDCFGNYDDYYATFVIQEHHNGSGYSVLYKSRELFHTYCGCWIVVDYHIALRFSWSPPDSSYVVNGFVRPDPLDMYPGETNHVRAWFVDQYGYGILRNVDSWWSSDENVVSVNNTTHFKPLVEAQDLGSANVSFQLGSLARSGVINVRSCAPELVIC